MSSVCSTNSNSTDIYLDNDFSSSFIFQINYSTMLVHCKIHSGPISFLSQVPSKWLEKPSIVIHNTFAFTRTYNT